MLKIICVSYNVILMFQMVLAFTVYCCYQCFNVVLFVYQLTGDFVANTKGTIATIIQMALFLSPIPCQSETTQSKIKSHLGKS